MILIAKMRSNAEAIPDIVPTPLNGHGGRGRESAKTRRTAEDGVTSTELAVLMPVLIALVLVPFQVALWWHANQVADAAAQEARRRRPSRRPPPKKTASTPLNGSSTRRQPHRRRTSPSPAPPTPSPSQVTGERPPCFPVRLGGHRPATGPIERFIPEPDR